MLMMVCVFVGFAKILLRFFVKSLFTTERAEVIGLPVVLGLASGGGGVNIHAADGIMYSSCHWWSPLLPILRYLLRIEKSQIAYIQSGLHAHCHREHEQVNVHRGEDNDQHGVGSEGRPDFDAGGFNRT